MDRWTCTHTHTTTHTLTLPLSPVNSGLVTVQLVRPTRVSSTGADIPECSRDRGGGSFPETCLDAIPLGRGVAIHHFL